MKNRIEILPGQYFDDETGLHYNWHRTYSSTIGRYLTPDPLNLSHIQIAKKSEKISNTLLSNVLLYQHGLLNPLTQNHYAYVSNNPNNNIDPMGLWMVKPICWKEECPRLDACSEPIFVTCCLFIRTGWPPIGVKCESCPQKTDGGRRS